MREAHQHSFLQDEGLTYRGEANARLNSLTDAVFGIALTLLIFNVSNANSFADILIFAKSFPALALSILFLYLIWKEHVVITMLHPINSILLQLLSVIFIAFVLFYVYPLRFLSALLTNIFFNTGLNIKIENVEVPQLMIFYGLTTFAIYFILFLFYLVVGREQKKRSTSAYEALYIKAHGRRLLLMSLVPFLSFLLTYTLRNHSVVWACMLGGFSYGLYPIFIQIWAKRFKQAKEALLSKP